MDSEIDWILLAQILVPAFGAWIASSYTNKRERAEWESKQEIEQQKALGGTVSQLSGAWGEMTTQLRELVTRLQVETIDAKTRAAIEANRAEKLERELETLRLEHKVVLRELDELRSRGMSVQIKPRKRTP